MRIIRLVLVVFLAACGGGDDPPSCQQAFTAYYAAGCSLIVLATGQPVSQGQATSDCQSFAASASNSCQSALDDWLVCVEDSTPAKNCDCSQDQMALLRCN